MSEKRYDLWLPMDNVGLGTIQISKQQARTIRLQCEQIEAEKDCADESPCKTCSAECDSRDDWVTLCCSDKRIKLEPPAPLPQSADITGILKEKEKPPADPEAARESLCETCSSDDCGLVGVGGAKDCLDYKKPEPWTPKAGEMCLWLISDGTNPSQVIPIVYDVDKKVWVCRAKNHMDYYGIAPLFLGPLPPKPEPRQWRNGDVVKAGVAGTVIFLAGKMYWLSDGSVSCYAPDQFRGKSDIYLGNLDDWLAQGEVPVFLTEEEADHLGTACIDKECQYRTATMEKVKVALATYREREKVSP